MAARKRKVPKPRATPAPEVAWGIDVTPFLRVNVRTDDTAFWLSSHAKVVVLEELDERRKFLEEKLMRVKMATACVQATEWPGNSAEGKDER